jgi:hypothetical protein
MPVPTITAVGVARPSAHGHAMARTLRAHRKTNCRRTSVLVKPCFSLSDTGKESMLIEPIIDHTIKVNRERKTTVGTK